MVTLRTLLLAATALLAGCERKAPGPAECVAFAEQVLTRAANRAESAALLRARYEELVRQCLTTPFDRRMLACVDETGDYRHCRLYFELRRQGAAR